LRIARASHFRQSVSVSVMMSSQLLLMLRSVRGLLSRNSRPLSSEAAVAQKARPSVGQQVVDLALVTVRTRARVYTGAAAITIAAMYYVWRTESEGGVVADMCGVFEAGGVSRWDASFTNDARASVERPVVEADLASILRPRVANNYAVIVGPSGTGKSTSVRKVVRALIAEGKGGAGAGIIYFSTRELLSDFSQDLAKAVGYRTPIYFFDRVRRFVTGETKEQAKVPLQLHEPRTTWSPLSRLLKDAATLHMTKHGTAPTLVLDAMDLVAKKDAAFFCEVQDFAKACADSGIMRVVFVFSDGDALPLLLSSSAESRCNRNQVYEVGNISNADAIKFVISRYGLGEARATELVETITGGRFTLLQNYGDTANPLEAIRKVLDIEANVKLRLAGVHATHPLLETLAVSKCITVDMAEDMLEPSKISALLRHNILAVHPNFTYTFNNPRMEAVVKQKLAIAREKDLAAREKEVRGLLPSSPI
jgi:hypothetical protein